MPDNDPWRPVLPVPQDAPKLTTATLSAFAPPGYAFTAGWRYRDGEGRFLGCIVRYDRPANGVPADKQVRPVTFCDGPDGKRGWRCKGFPEPRPLYGLDRLAARPEAPVLVVEGEKVADAAGKLCPDQVVITSPGGSNAARKADWRPLAGRRVTIWPDCDAPGAAYAADVAALAHAAGAAFAEVVTLPDGLPQKWDLADDLPAGMAWSLIEDALAAAMAGPAGPAPILSSLPAVLPFIYDRIGRGTVRIENCTLSLIGGVQPSRIAPIVRGAMSGASNDGLIQRLQLAVWPDDIGQWKWTDRHPDRDARERYQAAFDALAGSLPGTTEHPLVMRFSAAAQDLFRQWMEEIQSEARSGVLSSTMESHLLKMPATVASLALLFELIEGGRFEVGEDAIRRALGWADYLRSHASRLYASGNSVVEDGARLIVERRAQLPSPFTARDVHQKAWAGLSDRDAVSAASASGTMIAIMTPAGRTRPSAATPTSGAPLARPSSPSPATRPAYPAASLPRW